MNFFIIAPVHVLQNRPLWFGLELKINLRYKYKSFKGPVSWQEVVEGVQVHCGQETVEILHPCMIRFTTR